MTAVYLSASQVAAYLSKHPFKTRQEATLQLFKKVLPQRYEALCRKHGFVDDAALMQKVQECVPATETLAERTVEPSSVAENISTVLEAARGSDMQLSPSEEARMKRCVTSKFNTSMGIHKERPVLDRLRKSYFEPIETDDCLHKKLVTTTADGTQWYLCGRVDALMPESRTVVEIKNRVRGLFNRVASYEKIQIMCYMYLLDYEKALLVEAHGDQVRSYELVQDAADWKRLHTGLLEFIESFTDLANDEDSQDFLFQRV
jgi:hypothetical protein